ncbi:MAG: dihydropteroate synthase [Chloroflexota bacterium]
MFVIASNISTRQPNVASLADQLKQSGWDLDGNAAALLQKMAEQCVNTGADALEINTLHHMDEPEAMEAMVKIVQRATDRQLCLSTNHVETLKAGLDACKASPIVNYLSMEERRLQQMLPLAAERSAEVVLLVSEPETPRAAQDMLHTAAVLVGAAAESGISDGRLLVDPGLIHITRSIGQQHLVEVKKFLRSLPDVFEPPVRSTCWLANASAGAPKSARLVIETTLLAMLAGLGLSSVFIDVLAPDNMRVIRALKIFNNEVVYSEHDLEY